MNLITAVTFLRKNILDDVGGLDADWASFSSDDTDTLQLRWTNEEIVSNINEAMNQVYRRILPVKDSSNTFDISAVPGTSDYTLDPRILRIKGVRDTTTNKSLKQLDLEDVWENDHLFTEQKTPECYIVNYDSGSITFYKTPSENVVYSLLVYRLPLETLSWDDNYCDIELREEFIVPMLWYAAALCYEKDEANILDPERVAYFTGKFNREFTTTSAYSDTRKRRTARRSTRYGGL